MRAGAPALLLVALAAAPAAASVAVVFRFDDPSARSDTALEAAILAEFRARRLPVTFGVIPRVTAGDPSDPSPRAGLPLPPAKARLLRRAVEDGTLDAVQHGWSHQTARRARYDTELEGLPAAEQSRRLAEGRDLLEKALGARPEVFVPPWNGYDAATVSALEDLGFGALSGSLRGPDPGGSRLTFLPATCELAGLRDAVDSARASGDPDAAVVVLFHAGDADLPRLREDLDWVAAQPGVRVLSLTAAARTLRGLDSSRFRANRQALLWRLTPHRLRPRLRFTAPGVYLSRARARAAKRQWAALLAAGYSGLALAAFLVAGAAARLPGGSRSGCRPAAAVILAAVVPAALLRPLDARSAAIAAVLLGAAAALMRAGGPRRRRL